MSLLAVLTFFLLFDLILVLRVRYVVTPFNDFLTQYLDPKYVTPLLYRKSIYKEMSKAMYWSTLSIYLCFLTSRRPKISMFNSVELSSGKVFRVYQPW